MQIFKEDLENLFAYLQDKIEDCYKDETKIAIERFLEDNF